MERIILILLLLLTACNTQKRCARFVEKHPACFPSDTVMTFDTIYTTKISHDTALILSEVADTFIIEKERLRTQIIRLRDTLLVSSVVQPDTVIQTKTIIRQSKPVKNKMPYWVKVVIIITCCLIALAVTIKIVTN